MPSLNRNALKIIASASMILDHLAKALPLSGAAYVLCSDVIGRISFPLFCFLLAEGYRHTRSHSRYLLRVLLLALVSEIPYDLVFSHTLLEFHHQNTCFSLFLGLLLFSVLSRIRTRFANSRILPLLLSLAAAFLFAAAAYFLHADYQYSGLLSMYVLGLLRLKDPIIFFPPANAPASTMALSALVLNLPRFPEPAALLAAIPAALYDGTPGRKGKWLQFGFYLFYPLHLLVLSLLC